MKVVLLKVELTETDAFKTAEGSALVKEARKGKKLILASAMAILDPDRMLVDRWHVSYLDAKRDELTSFLVTKEGVLSSETSGRAVKREPAAVSAEPKTGVEKALETTLAEMRREFPLPLTKIFVTYYRSQRLGKECWSVAFLAKSLTTYIVKLDAATGKIVSRETQNLLG